MKKLAYKYNNVIFSFLPCKAYNYKNSPNDRYRIKENLSRTIEEWCDNVMKDIMK